MKLLLTGTSGFIGSNLIRKLFYERRGLDVVSIDRFTHPQMVRSRYVNEHHRIYVGDCADAHFVDTVFGIEHPEVVIHLAAESFVDASIASAGSFVTANVLGTQVMCDAAVKYRTRRFVLTSTDEVYGQLTSEADPLWTESSPMAPRNPYAASKAAAELMVRAAGATHGLPYCITRSSNNYGPRQLSEKFIPKIIQSILAGQPIPVYGQGLQIRDWTHVHDNCAALMHVMDGTGVGETYNVAANQEFSNIEVVNLICNHMGRGHELIRYVADRPSHDFRYGCDSTKVRQLGWQPTIRFREGIQRTVDWYQINKHLLAPQ